MSISKMSSRSTGLKAWRRGGRERGRKGEREG